MDPTDIVLVPFDLQRLASYVAATSCTGSLASPWAHSNSSSLQKWAQATIVFWIMAVVCGTPPTREIYHTALASAYLATLTVLLPVTATTTTAAVQGRKKNNKSLDAQQLLATCQVHATLFLTVPFQVLRLYDWGSQIQRWPLPILLGSTYGYVAGSVLGGVLLVALHYSPRFRQWFDHWTLLSSPNGQPTDNNHHQD